jgi:hypothetical protein
MSFDEPQLFVRRPRDFGGHVGYARTAPQRRSNLGWRAGLTELGRLPHGTEMADGVGKVWLGRDRLHNTCVFSRYR